MSIQLNIGDHTSSEAGYIAIPNRYRASARWARTKAKWIARNFPAADVYFRRLPQGRSLSDLLADRSIWVNFWSTAGAGDYGEAIIGGTELAISNLAFRWGRWTVLGTLIHELAHIDGAPGGRSQVAERALLACGLGKQSELRTGRDDPETPFNPTIEG